MEFKKLLEEINPLSPETLKALEAIALRESFPRGAAIGNVGKKNQYVDIVDEGIAMVCMDVDGNEKILAIGEEGSPFASAYSLNTAQPAIFFLRALTDCTLVRFPADKFWEVCAHRRDLEQWMNRWFLLQMSDIEWKCGWYSKTTIYERYCNFMTARPRAAKELTTAQIAGYLDCTRETISRCRSRFLKQK